MGNRDFPADPPASIVDETDAVAWSAAQSAVDLDPLTLDIEACAAEAVPTIPMPDTPPWVPVDLAPPVLDIETSASEAVPTLPMPDNDWFA